MDRLVRLSEAGGSSAELRLLRAARGDGPVDDLARRKTLAALAAAPFATAAGMKAPSLLAKLGPAAVAKWSIVSVVVVGAGAVTLRPLVQRPTAVHAHAGAVPAPAVQARAGVETPHPALAPISTASPATVNVEDLPRAPNPVAPRVQPASAAPLAEPSLASPVGSSSTLRAEALMIEHARELLASGNAAGADRAISAFASRYPNSTLAEDAAALRVQVAVALHDLAGASALAASFERAYPQSSYLPAMKKSIAR